MAALDRISIAAIGDTAADLAEQASSAEAAGIDCVWTPELFRSSVTQATWLAAKTEKVGIGTGIAWAFTRSAFILAVSALDIDEMSGGRFRLGLGAGVKRLNETWHSVDYGKPAPHLRETIEATRLIMEKASTGEPIRYEGEYQDIDIKGWVRPHKPVRERVPIYAAAMQEGMCRMAGRRRRRPDRPPDVPGALARRGDAPELSRPACRAPDASARDRLHPHRVLRDRRRRGPRPGRRPPDDRLLLDRPHLQAALGDARLRRRRRRRPATHSARATSPPCPKRSPTRWSMPTRPPGRSTRSARGSKRLAERGDGVFLTPATYFIPPEQIGEYQTKLIEAFGPA